MIYNERKLRIFVARALNDDSRGVIHDDYKVPYPVQSSILCRDILEWKHRARISKFGILEFEYIYVGI